MKRGTVEYTIRTERKPANNGNPEQLLTEYWFKARGHDSDDTFNQENVDSKLITDVRAEHARILSDPTILKYESRVVQGLTVRE